VSETPFRTDCKQSLLRNQFPNGVWEPDRFTDSNMARRKIEGSRMIVTGASSGIGRALVRRLAERGARLVITARREERLSELKAECETAPGDVAIVPGDITEPDLRQRLLDAAGEHYGGLDVLINNAGIGAMGPFAEADEKRLRQVMEVDFFAAAELIRSALPLLRQSTRPMIVNVASVLAHRAIPGKSEYCAAKFALHGLSDSIRAELKGEGIDVLLVSPSTTSTEFFEREIDARGRKPGFTKYGSQSPDQVARHAVNAIRRGKDEVILTLGGKALVWLDRLCPPLANWVIARFTPEPQE